MFKCGFCGKEYESAQDYVKCVSKCAEEAKQKEEAEKRNKLAKEKQARFEEIKRLAEQIDTLEKEFKSKVNKYNKDYRCESYFWLV